MEKTDNMPIWVYFAFSSIPTRKAAIILISASTIFTFMCIPFPLVFDTQAWPLTEYFITDWSWLAMMLPVTLWYWLSLKWVDNHAGWDTNA